MTIRTFRPRDANMAQERDRIQAMFDHAGETDQSLNTKLQIYFEYIKTAERNIDRRGETNRYFQTILAAVIGVMVFLAAGELKFLSIASTPVIGLALAAMGIIVFALGIFWGWQLEAHSRLSTIKYTILHMMEEDLPYTPFSREVEEFEARKWRFSMVSSEKWLPRLLTLLGLVLAGGGFYSVFFG